MTIAEEEYLRRYTRDEYYLMAEVGMFHGQRVELIDGKVIVMSPQNDPHASIIMQLNHILTRKIPEDFRVRPQLPLAVSDVSEPEPDIAIIRLEPGVIRGRDGCPTTAKLVIEVADSSLSRAKKKANLYASAAIPEYWIVDVQGKKLYVFKKPVSDSAEDYGARYDGMGTLSMQDAVTPEFVPVGELRVAQLFPN